MQQRVTQSGMERFLTKPAEATLIYELIRLVINRREEGLLAQNNNIDNKISRENWSLQTETRKEIFLVKAKKSYC